MLTNIIAHQVEGGGYSIIIVEGFKFFEYSVFKTFLLSPHLTLLTLKFIVLLSLGI